jgi:hypothetical protein
LGFFCSFFPRREALSSILPGIADLPIIRSFIHSSQDASQQGAILGLAGGGGGGTTIFPNTSAAGNASVVI